MFTKSFMGVGGNFHGGKLTPENASQEHCPPFLPHPPPPPIPPPKKKEKKRKLTQENIIS